MSNLVAAKIDTRIKKSTKSPGTMYLKNGLLSASNLPSITKKLRAVTPREGTRGFQLDNVRLRMQRKNEDFKK